MRKLSAVLIVGLAVPALRVEAQAGITSLRGQVVSRSGSPVSNALIRIEGQNRTVEARADSTGVFVFPGLSIGRWRVVVQSLGFMPDTTMVELTDDQTTIRVQLRSAATDLDLVLVSARWWGVRGVVGTKGYTPLADASVEVVGRKRRTRTNAAGFFALELSRNESYLLRVEREGFRDRLFSIRLADTRVEELSVLLDSANNVPWELNALDELDRRLRMASPMSARVARGELLKYAVGDLSDALALSSSMLAKGLVLNRDACVFLDGVARPGLPVDAVDPRTVEFVEVYGPSDDRSGTLARRWPPNAPCGVDVPQQMRRSGVRGATVRYVVVWSRK
ncbi:MAG: carboxypeptidase regulatory-like domain-containing protein [Gemmatimonadaceae bacterium]|jgi:hypothetical protein|nr:carboxypeptidase regulatory-like domain-containing protein [Gemmatimonadaceae bacterium]